MLLKYRTGMSGDELAAFMAEIERLDQCYADAAAFDAANAAALPPDADADEYEEGFDPVRDGWVDRNTGRP